VLKGEIDFRLGSKQRLCGQDDVIVIPGGTEHEGSFREDSEVIDFFAPSRDNFLLGGKPAYMKYSGGVNHSDVAPIEGSCSAIGLHLLIEPVTRPLASWNVVTPLLSVRAVPVTRLAGS
jgi:hypothetical protein